jgi:hypothetical protein
VLLCDAVWMHVVRQLYYAILPWCYRIKHVAFEMQCAAVPFCAVSYYHNAV